MNLNGRKVYVFSYAGLTYINYDYVHFMNEMDRILLNRMFSIKGNRRRFWYHYREDDRQYFLINEHKRRPCGYWVTRRSSNISPLFNWDAAWKGFRETAKENRDAVAKANGVL